MIPGPDEPSLKETNLQLWLFFFYFYGYTLISNNRAASPWVYWTSVIRQRQSRGTDGVWSGKTRNNHCSWNVFKSSVWNINDCFHFSNSGNSPLSIHSGSFSSLRIIVSSATIYDCAFYLRDKYQTDFLLATSSGRVFSWNVGLIPGVMDGLVGAGGSSLLSLDNALYLWSESHISCSDRYEK